MPDRRCIAVVAAIAAVALAPGAALAQTGAGDEQYQDPFSGNSQPAPKAKPKPTPTPVQPVPHQQLPSKQTLTATQSPSELPRTGPNLLPLTLAGVGLVAAGLLLLVRRRASDGRH